MFIASSALSMRFPAIVMRASDGRGISEFLKRIPSLSINLTLHSEALAIFPIRRAAKEALSSQI